MRKVYADGFYDLTGEKRGNEDFVDYKIRMIDNAIIQGIGNIIELMKINVNTEGLCEVEKNITTSVLLTFLRNAMQSDNHIQWFHNGEGFVAVEFPCEPLNYVAEIKKDEQGYYIKIEE